MEFAIHSFFKTLKSILGPNINMTQWVADVLECTENTAWRRINDKRKLTVTEMLKLIEAEPQLGIKAAELFRRHDLNVVQVRGFHHADSFYQYLSTIKSLLENASKYADFRMRYMARDLPLFYFLGNENALRHKFRLWTGDDKGNAEMLTLDTYKVASDLYELYLSLPTEEIWYDRAFEHQYRQLTHLVKKNFMNADDAMEIMDYFQSQEQNLQMALRSGKKSGGGELLAAQCPMALNNNGALLAADGKEQLLGSIMSAQYFYARTPALVDQFNGLWTKHLSWCDEKPDRMVYLDMRYHEERGSDIQESA
jgi:hypothetical protein